MIKECLGASLLGKGGVGPYFAPEWGQPPVATLSQEQLPVSHTGHTYTPEWGQGCAEAFR